MLLFHQWLYYQANLYVSSTYAVTYEQQSDITCRRFIQFILGTVTQTYNTNNNNITTTNEYIYFNNAQSGSTLNVNLGSSILTSDERFLARSTGASKVLNLDLGSSTINVPDDVTFTNDGGLTLTEGTSTINMNGTGNQDLKSDGVTLYDIVLDNIGGGLTLTDAVDCNTLLCSDGDFNQNGQTITAVSAITLNNVSDIILLDAQITFSDDATFTIITKVAGVAHYYRLRYNI